VKSEKSQGGLGLLFDASCDETCRIGELEINNCVLQADFIRKLGREMSSKTCRDFSMPYCSDEGHHSGI
jgi:hypothetical protein